MLDNRVRFSRRSVIGRLGAAAAATLLAGCSSPTPTPTAGPSSKPAAAPAAQVTLTVLMAPNGERAVEDAITKFQTERNIKVDLTMVNWQDLQIKLTSSTAGGSPYDIMQAKSAWFPQLLASDWIKPINDLMPKEYFQGMSPSLTQEMSIKEKLYGIPFRPNIMCMLYNPEALQKGDIKKPPETWDQLIEMGRTLMDRKVVEYAMPMFYNTSASTFKDYASVIASFGGQYFDKDGNPVMNNEAGVTALQYFVDFYHKHKIVDQGSFAPKEGLQEIKNIASGKTAFWLAWPYHYSQTLQGSQVETPGKARLMLIPGGLGVKSGAGWNLSGFTLSKDTKHTSESAELIRAVTTEQVIRDRVILGGQLPIWDKLYEDPDVLKKFPDVKVIQEQYKYNLVPEPALIWFGEFAEIFRIAVSDAVNQKKSPKQAMDWCASESKDRIKKYGQS